MAVSQQEIAKAAGVSRGTVDRVFHNRPNVSAGTREKVLRAAEALGYRKPQPAGVSTRATILIPRWSDAHFNRKISSGLIQARSRLGDPSFLVKERILENWTSQEMLRSIREEVEDGVQGLILRPENVPAVQAAIEEAVRRGVKVVTYDTDIPDCGRICHVGQDLHLVGQIAAGLLAKLLPPDAHILIALGNIYMEVHKGRVDGFCRRLKELGFPGGNLRMVEGGEMFDLTEDLIVREFKRDPKIRAVYMATEPVSSCVSGIRKAHLSQRPYVVCNDLTPTTRRYLRNGDVDYCIEQAFEQKSCRAVLAMYAALKSGSKPKNEVIYTDFHIVTQEMVLS